MKKFLATYDKTAVFKELIEPLLEQAHALAEEHDIPLTSVCTFQREINDEGTQSAGSATVSLHQTCPGLHDPDMMLLARLMSVVNEGEEHFVGNPLYAVTELLEADEQIRNLVQHLAENGHIEI